MEQVLAAHSHTLSRSYLPTSLPVTGSGSSWQTTPPQSNEAVNNISSNDGSTGKGILIGMLSAFGSAAFVILVFAIFYLLRYTNQGRILLDRLGRPGEFDDEQALAREEADALDEMDDLERGEYLRAKGMSMRWLTSNTIHRSTG